MQGGRRCNYTYTFFEITKSRFQCSKGKPHRWSIVTEAASNGDRGEVTGTEAAIRGHSRQVYRESFRRLSEDKDKIRRSRLATMRTSLNDILRS